MIQIIQYGQLRDLRYLASQANSAITPEAIDDVTGPLHRFRAADALGDRGLRYGVRRFCEEVMNVALEYPALQAMLSEVALQVTIEPVEREINALAALARAIVIDEVPGHLWIERVVAQAALELPVLYPGRYDLPLLWFMKPKDLVRVNLVGPLYQRLLQFIGVLKRINGVTGHTVFPHDIPATLL